MFLIFDRARLVISPLLPWLCAKLNTNTNHVCPGHTEVKLILIILSEPGKESNLTEGWTAPLKD